MYIIITRCPRLKNEKNKRIKLVENCKTPLCSYLWRGFVRIRRYFSTLWAHLSRIHFFHVSHKCIYPTSFLTTLSLQLRLPNFSNISGFANFLPIKFNQTRKNNPMLDSRMNFERTGEWNKATIFFNFRSCFVPSNRTNRNNKTFYTKPLVEIPSIVQRLRIEAMQMISYVCTPRRVIS